MNPLSSQERILRTIAGQPVDRVPIFAPLSWNPLSPEPKPDDWKAQPNYRRLVALAEKHCDFYAELEIAECASFRNLRNDYHISGIQEGLFDRRFFLVPPDFVELSREETIGNTRYLHYTVHTPQGDLTTTESIISGEDTVWENEPLIKDVDDAEKLLAVPYRFDKPDLTQYFADREKLGNRGVAVCFITSPMVMISRLTGFQRFLEWTITERPLVDRMIRTVQERISERLQYVLDKGAGPIIRFGGSEQATPPMMSNRFFDQFVMQYERPLWQLVRDAGCIVWVHCHGKVATVIDRFRDSGVQLLDPVEPPPQGDIEFGVAKRRAASGPLTLIGNVEISVLQDGTPDQIETLVKQAICDGGPSHMILGASDKAISAVNDQLRDNIVRFIEAGHKYGQIG
jgi:hypothetical protein